MFNRKTTAILVIVLAICVGLYQEAAAAEKESDDVTYRIYEKLNRNADTPKEPEDVEGKSPMEELSLKFRPLRLLLRLLALITFPPRFLARFFFTFAATLFLVVFECQVIPEVNCGVSLKELIPDVMQGLKEELDFLTSLAPDEE